MEWNKRILAYRPVYKKAKTLLNSKLPTLLSEQRVVKLFSLIEQKLWQLGFP
jgi:hypothetical protein